MWFFLFIALIPARSNSLFSGVFTENSKSVPDRIDRDDFTEAPGCACFFPFRFYRSFFSDVSGFILRLHALEDYATIIL